MRVINLDSGESTVPAEILFSGGEPHIQLPLAGIRGQRVYLEAHVSSALDFMKMVLMVDIVARASPKAFGLYLPYVPGGRQDFVVPGRCATLNVYTDIIRRLRVDAIVTVVPHSRVTPSLLHPMKVLTIEAADIIPATWSYNGVIAPDAGADVRATAVAGMLKVPCYFATKKRDSGTGRIDQIDPPKLSTPGRYLVVDDICDGGATFIKLAQSFPPSACIFDLFVAHGIFSKGFRELAEHYEIIYTTDAFRTLSAPLDRFQLKVIPLLSLVNAKMKEALS